MKFNSVLETIGNTPHVRLNKIFPSEYHIWMKLEKMNPGGSIKDRIALSMIQDAEKKGVIKPGAVIIEPTSGNTGIGLAMVGAVKGYRTILVMPESMSVERRAVMSAYGAEIVLTPRSEGMKGSIEKAEELHNSIRGSWIPSQFDNPSNPEVHEKFTSVEIIEDFPDGIDYLFAGVGTGGHISGLGRALKKAFPKMLIYAVEPSDSPVISGGDAGPHKIQGIGAGFIPDNFDRKVIDDIVTISSEDSFNFARKVAKNEGLFIGISSGAVLAAIAGKLPEIPQGSTILCVNYDTGDRYLSVDGLF